MKENPQCEGFIIHHFAFFLGLVQPLQGCKFLGRHSAGSALAPLALHRRLLMLRTCGAGKIY